MMDDTKMRSLMTSTNLDMLSSGASSDLPEDSQNPISFKTSHTIPWPRRLVEFYNAEGPWHPPIDPTPEAADASLEGALPSQDAFMSYRSRPPMSDCDTSLPCDSGYISNPVAGSIGVTSTFGGEDCADTERVLHNFHLTQDQGNGGLEAQLAFINQAQQEAMRDNSKPTNPWYTCKECGAGHRTKSEYK